MPSSIPKGERAELNVAGERVDLLTGFAAGGVDALVRAAFDAAADGLAVFDPRSPGLAVLHANRRLGEVLGTDAAALRGQALVQWSDALGATVLQELAERVTRGQRSRVGEVLLSPGQPQQRWMRVTVAPLDATPSPLLLATFTDISDRRAIDVVTATLPVELIGLDRDLLVRWANPAAAAAAGMSVEEMIGRSFLQIMPSTVERREIYERVLAGEALDFECVPLWRTPGSVRYYQTSLRPLRDVSGDIAGLIAMARDVTDRELARRAMSDAEHRFAAMIQGSNDVITILGADGRILFESPSIERMTGDPPAVHVGRPVFDFVHPDDAEMLRGEFSCAAQAVGSKHRPVTFRFRHRDGHYIWLESTATNSLDDPAIRGIVAVSRDVTRRRAAEAAVDESRAKLELALSGAAVGTWEYDVLTGIHRFDSRCATLIGRNDPEVVVDLEGLAALTHPEDVLSARAALLRHLRGEVTWYETEYRARGPGGEWRWFAARGRASERAADGRVLKISGVLIDIDARKRAERDARRTSALLDTASADGSVALWSSDLVTGTRTVTESWVAMSGYSLEEWSHISNEQWLAAIHPEDRARVLDVISRLVRGQSDAMSEEIEYRFRTRQGDWIWLSARARVAERDPDGRSLRLVGRTLDVTAHKRMRQFLQETQSAAGVGGWELNLRTGALSWTDETYQLFDTTREEFAPSMERTFPLYLSQYHPAMQAAVEGAVERGEPFDITVECRTLKDRHLWLRLIGKAERINGESVRLYGAKQDVTRVVLADAALKKSAAELRALASNAPDWLALLDLDMRIRFVNYAVRGISPESAIGIDAMAIVPEHLRPSMRRAAAEVMATGLPVMVEGRMRRINDVEALFEFHAAPVTESGAVVGLSVRITDVTEARRKEATLRTQGRMLETLREGVLLIGADGRVRIANAAAGRMFGEPVAELLGRDVRDLGLDPRRMARLRELAPTGAGQSIEWLARRRDGDTFLAEAAVSELHEAGETLTIAVILDVTERKMLERAIIDATNREQQRIGHDLHDGLGQELTGISLMLRSYAQRSTVEYPKGAPLINEVVELVNHAVDSARALAHGLSPVILERGGLPAALAQLAASASRTHGRRVRFRKSISAPLLLDSTSTHHLYRIAQEAVTNAARHSGAQTVTLRLDVGPDRLLLSITDDGCGLAMSPGRLRGSGGCLGAESDGMGLRIMEFRARMIHAQFRIGTTRRGGTRVSCRLALPSPHGDPADADSTAP